MEIGKWEIGKFGQFWRIGKSMKWEMGNWEMGFPKRTDREPRRRLVKFYFGCVFGELLCLLDF